MRYRERLTVAWWMWPAGLGLASLMAAELQLGHGGLRAWLPYAILLSLTAIALAGLGRLRLQVSGDELLVDDARIARRFLSSARPLDADETRRILGPDLHPFAFVVRRPWIRSAVLIMLDDPADPTPYWVVSTRRPQAVIAALTLESKRSSLTETT